MERPKNEVPTEIVRHAATRLVRRLPSVVRYDDLYSAGLTALVEASRRFDVSRGVDFRTYAKHRVYGAMLDELRNLDTLSRDKRKAIRDGTEGADEIVVPRLVDLSHAYGVATNQDMEGDLDKKRSLERLSEAIKTLNERYQLVISLREKGLTLKEIGDHLGVTEARACQLMGECVDKLRAVMKTNENSNGFAKQRDDIKTLVTAEITKALGSTEDSLVVSW